MRVNDKKIKPRIDGASVQPEGTAPLQKLRVEFGPGYRLRRKENQYHLVAHLFQEAKADRIRTAFVFYR